jgi:pimeloyl-ACP methyl ester carboxylesterase
MSTPRKRPIILIPGIQGTKLFNTNEKDFQVIWSGVKKNFSNITKLALQKDGTSDSEIEMVVERADVENLAYSEIVNYLRSLGYRVFIFGYDWRKSNLETAEKLESYIDKLKNKLNVNSFNFLTHSMGCLVLSSYFKRLGDEQKINDIVNKVIFTVPPVLGSVESTFNLVAGKSRLFNSSDDFRKIARTFPSIYELLPVYEGAYTFKNTARQKDFDYSHFDSYWQHVPNATRPDTIVKQNLIRHRLSDMGAARSHNDFIYDFHAVQSETLKKKLLVIVGTGEDTRVNVVIKDKVDHVVNYFDFDHPHAEGDGDGTVPHASGIAFKDTLLTLKVKSRKVETWADGRFIMTDWHAFFLNNGRVQNVITRFFKPRNAAEVTALEQKEWYHSIGSKIAKVQ